MDQYKLFIDGKFLDATGGKKLQERIREEVKKLGYLTFSKPFKPSTMLEIVKEYLNT
jgi:hypothetical protein